MATPELIEVDNVVDIINCVALYYEKGASGNAFLRKEKFRCPVSRQVKSLKALKETVSQFGGIRDVAKNIGLGNQITIKLARLDKSDSKGAQCFAINTDGQVTLELPSIRAGTDMLQLIVYPIEIAFATSSQRIVVQVKTVEGSSAPQPTPAPDDNSHVTLTEEEKLKLNEELKDLSDSKLVEGTAETVYKKKKKVTWAWKIQCGVCSKHVQLRIDGAQAGRISYFKSHHFNTCQSRKSRKRPQAQKPLTSFFAKKAKEADVQAPAADSDVDGSDTETHTEDEVVDQTEHHSDIEAVSDSESQSVTASRSEDSQREVEDSDVCNDSENESSVTSECQDKDWRLVCSWCRKC
ncbi:unnamed protein product [Porites evermanni]|uniref:Uncharacterized protein n=1 Tax=Porites evermanni TaxID=104178 RepID=A0ABN8PEG6_9CNID|nr:unnamed protein product [Porites evermanni]